MYGTLNSLITIRLALRLLFCDKLQMNCIRTVINRFKFQHMKESHMQHSLAIHDDECIAFEHFQLTELGVHTNFE